MTIYFLRSWTVFKNIFHSRILKIKKRKLTVKNQKCILLFFTKLKYTTSELVKHFKWVGSYNLKKSYKHLVFNTCPTFQPLCKFWLCFYFKLKFSVKLLRLKKKNYVEPKRTNTKIIQIFLLNLILCKYFIIYKSPLWNRSFFPWKIVWDCKSENRVSEYTLFVIIHLKTSGFEQK